jgi:3-dehydrosphinganine reductase
MGSFEGKRAFVTGGSSGIGKAAALQLVREGASVWIAARGQARLDEALAELKAAARSPAQVVGAVSLDVTDRAACRAAAAAAVAALGGIDLLINNSGFSYPGVVDSQEDHVFDEMIQTNYMGHVNVTRAFLPTFEAQKSGHICMVTSMLGFMSFYGYAAYSASKFAIVGFSEALRQELLPHNVQVSVFYPPTTETPGLETENKTKPPATWAIEGKSTSFTSDQVATALLNGIRANRFVNMVGLEAWAVYYANRWVPGVVRWFLDGELKKFLAKKA